MIVSTKNRSTRFHSDKFHTSYGIQNWLCNKGYIVSNKTKHRVDEDKYKQLLKEFILFDNPEFDFTKLKHGLQSMEKYVQNRFPKFCGFCNKKFKE